MLSILCFRHLVVAKVLFRVRWCLRLLLLCYLCLSRNGPDMVLRLTFVSFFQNLFVVLLPSSMVHFSSEVFSVGLVVPKILVGIPPYIVLLREMILVLLCFSVCLVSIWFDFFFIRFDSVFVCFVSQPFFSVHEEFGISSTRSVSGFF